MLGKQATMKQNATLLGSTFSSVQRTNFEADSAIQKLSKNNILLKLICRAL
jgi:hypothetical protein